jgi:hypothetical protein
MLGFSNNISAMICESDIVYKFYTILAHTFSGVCCNLIISRFKNK